jgi:hypothetical protein
MIRTEVVHSWSKARDYLQNETIEVVAMEESEHGIFITYTIL